MRTYDIDPKLIDSVRRNPHLYNKSLGPSNSLNRRQAWMAVSHECQLPMDQCQARWKLLRDRYVREINKSSQKGFALFENLNFLREHIHLRRKCTPNVSDPHTTSFTYYIDEMTQDEAASSMIMECPLQEQREVQEPEQIPDQGREQEQEYLSEHADTSSVEFVAEETVTANEPSTDHPNPLPLPANNPIPAMEHLSAFSKVINMLEQALKDKAKLAEPQDPFYKYLESILSRVDESTRCNIQIGLLNMAHEEISKAAIL